MIIDTAMPGGDAKADHDVAYVDDGVDVDASVLVPGVKKIHDPLSLPDGPVTRSRVKKFELKLLGYMRSHLDAWDVLKTFMCTKDLFCAL